MEKKNKTKIEINPEKLANKRKLPDIQILMSNLKKLVCNVNWNWSGLNIKRLCFCIIFVVAISNGSASAKYASFNLPFLPRWRQTYKSTCKNKEIKVYPKLETLSLTPVRWCPLANPGHQTLKQNMNAICFQLIISMVTIVYLRRRTWRRRTRRKPTCW